jgi:hypothetical protein
MRRYSHSREDHFELWRLYESWGFGDKTPRADELPLVGLIEPGVAAMFLYKTDSAICSLEHAITMRGARGHTEAIHAMVDALTATARECGFKRIFIYVGNEQAKSRAIATGFTLSDNPERWQLERTP